MLDVLRKEPPDAGYPVWTTSGIRLTPHIASTPDPSEVGQSLAGNIDWVKRGDMPTPLVDRARGY